ncbi:unnamed protein product [Dovyalis caffra]|uniref:Chaperone DnaJ C-terminal domain-containing protein n=1 Tax=Dovyalis caffra TaxID=77055 RepID=A0AAV1QP31_9ROSI|nr:unnamed protein product [Dovyalis caffra]
MASRSSSRGAEDVFSEVFGFNGSNQYRRGTVFSSNIHGDDIFSSFGEGIKDPPIKNTLPCSLEELYQGATKRVKITREVVDLRGLTKKIEEILTIDTKPGWKKGTKITFSEKGNKRPNVIPADIVFTVDEKPHSEFSRDGNDLIITRRISVTEAFTEGCPKRRDADPRRSNKERNFENQVRNQVPNKGNCRAEGRNQENLWSLRSHCQHVRHLL